jgi:hypothetical protein
LLDSVEANSKSALKKQKPGAARRSLKEMCSTPAPANVDRQATSQRRKKRFQRQQY